MGRPGDWSGDRRNQPRGFRGDDRVQFWGERPGQNTGEGRGFDRERRSFPRAERDAAPEPAEKENAAEIVCGHHAVESLLQREPRRIQRLLLERGAGDPRLYQLQKLAENAGVPCQQLLAKELSIRALGRRHQGVVAVCNVREFADWGTLRSELLAKVEAGEAPIVIVAAAIEDPRNLGAIVRTCVGMGADALLLPRKGGCGLTPIVEEVSAGALTHLPVSRPNDLEKVLEDLTKAGFQVCGLDARGEDIRSISFAGPQVLVSGGEDRGIPPHLRRPCDRLIRLPMSASLQSYNASVACAIALYEMTRNRA